MKRCLQFSNDRANSKKIKSVISNQSILVDDIWYYIFNYVNNKDTRIFSYYRIVCKQWNRIICSFVRIIIPIPIKNPDNYLKLFSNVKYLKIHPNCFVNLLLSCPRLNTLCFSLFTDKDIMY